ncbi:MAG: hypothetical protein PHG18_02450, partial [Bacilli bacterium]|nr:hypothetical protein [Bacilli bacterium]
MKKNFLLLIWALALSGVLFAQSAVYVDGFNGESSKGNTSIPEIELSDVLSEYTTSQDIVVTALIQSNGLIDQLCAVEYELYKDDVLIVNIADYGTLAYKIRQEGNTYHEEQLTQGSGTISITVAEESLSAFTLGLFDNFCINRNRPVELTANFTVPGVYRMVTKINSCSNFGIPTGSTFTATNCDGAVHIDKVGETCENPTELSSQEVTIIVNEPPTPEIEFSEILPEYIIGSDVEVTASVYSNGLIDQLCGIGYEIYKDDVLITNIADYGTLTYDVRQEGDTYYNGILTDGSGMIEVVVAEDNIGAFTLGIFDNYCVNRNRPVDFTANFTAPGVYKMVTSIYSCSNTGIAAGTSFTATNCDGEIHADMIGATCQNPTELSSEELIITVVEPPTPEIEFSEILPEYIIGSDVEVTASVYSNGLIDQLCGIGYEIYKDDVLITNIADYGTLTYDVRQEGDTYYNGVLTDGSGMIEVVVAEDNIGAFTLGIFDNYCVNRNRPVDFTANFTAPGVYKMVTSIYSCSNTGIAAGTSFTASNCDGEIHADVIRSE